MGKDRDLISKRTEEKELVAYMIKLYCRKKHKNKELCEKCRDLLFYAERRIELCPFMEEKTFCSSCKSHCYQKEKRQQMKEVMRWAGPRLLFYRPVIGWKHVFDTWQRLRRDKKAQNKQDVNQGKDKGGNHGNTK